MAGDYITSADEEQCKALFKFLLEHQAHQLFGENNRITDNSKQ